MFESRHLQYFFENIKFSVDAGKIVLQVPKDGQDKKCVGYFRMVTCEVADMVTQKLNNTEIQGHLIQIEKIDIDPTEKGQDVQTKTDDTEKSRQVIFWIKILTPNFLYILTPLRKRTRIASPTQGVQIESENQTATRETRSKSGGGNLCQPGNLNIPAVNRGNLSNREVLVVNRGKRNVIRIKCQLRKNCSQCLIDYRMQSDRKDVYETIWRKIKVVYEN